MKFIHTDLGHRSQGDIVEVTLSSAANVRLMNTTNFSAYRNGRQHRFNGGLAKSSPTHLTIPAAGHWHLAVDMQGLRGSVRTSSRIIAPAALRPLPPIKEGRRGLQAIADNLAEVAPSHDAAEARDYDVFISYASEDKDDVVRPLAEALQIRGLAVWFDEFTLKIGDSLRRKIDSGMAALRRRGCSAGRRVGASVTR